MKLSAILHALPKEFAGKEISVGDLIERLAGQAYGVVLFLLALPNLIPMPAPGLSLITGAPLTLFALQWALGINTPYFPGFIARRSIERQVLENMCTRSIPYIKKLETVFRPRLAFLVRPPARRLMAALSVMLSLMIVLPVPFGNALPALAICCFALAMLQADGLFVILGLIITFSSVTTVWLFMQATTFSIARILGA